MKSTIKSFLNFFLIIFIIVSITYISFFTDIPTKTGNFVRKEIEENTNSFEEYNNDFKINELGIQMNAYYYSFLTDDQKKIYESIANGVKNFQNEFVIRDYIAQDKDKFASEVSIAIEAFINDHPEVFYLQSEYSSYILSSFEGNLGYIRVNYTEESIDEVNKKIELMSKKIDEYLEGLEGLNDFEKELKIHDRLSYAVEYSHLDDLPREYHTAEGTLLENVGVCDSFTKALQLIYNRAGINSIIVLGSLDGNPHAWNMVNINNEWYHVDLTSSHSIYEETGIVNHAYFNLNTEAFKKFAIIDNEELLPQSQGNTCSYYNYNDLIIKEDDDIYQRLESICNVFAEDNYIEFYVEGNVGNKISTILIALRDIDSTFLDGTRLYYYNIENAIIIPKN